MNRVLMPATALAAMKKIGFCDFLCDFAHAIRRAGLGGGGPSHMQTRAQLKLILVA